MADFSEETQQAILTELYQDGQRVTETCQRLLHNVPKIEYSERQVILEKLTYTTEQMRLKLKLLGAPRIYN